MAHGKKDAATVTPDGRSMAPTIDGVRTRSTPLHVDHRGTLFEIFEGLGSYWDEPVVYAYQFSVAPHQKKGWGVHDEKIDRYTVISGEVHVMLWDDRDGSPTRGVVQRVVLSERALRQVSIPVGVWHLNLNLGDTEAFVINFPTQVYHHGSPDRRLLDWDDPVVPIDLRAMLPDF